MATLDRRGFLAAAGGAVAVGLAPDPGHARGAVAPARDDLIALSLKAAGELVRARKVSPVELTHACLDRIARHNGPINAFVTVTADRALADARRAEAEIMAGRWRGPLHGVPLALKDNIDTAGIRTTAASEVYAERVPGEDAPVVRRLTDAGMVLLGKLNMGEFAMGESVVSYYGAIHNPWALDREAGGSSSGAGAGLAADFFYGALGTDTAGSIRMPAAHCSVVGLKPTYGLVSNRGTVPLIESLDHVGPLAKTVEDAALILGAIAGYDPLWSASRAAPAVDYGAAALQGAAGLRVGAARTPYLDNADPEIVAAYEAALTVIRGLTAQMRDMTGPSLDINIGALFAGETYAYHRPLQAAHAGEYQPSNRNKFHGPATENAWDAVADYVEAKRALDEARRRAPTYFETVDVMVLPTVRYLARKNDALLDEVNRGVAVGGSNTRPFDLLGLPAITVPCGFSRSGLPIGLQIVGPPLAEARVLQLAHAFEAATAWHMRRPRLTP